MTVRALTKGEIALAKTVFGDSIDYATVTISDQKFMGFHADGTAMAPNGKLYMYGCYQEDYSRQDVLRQSLFIHEMTHVWQYQNKVLAPIVEALKLNVKHKFNYSAAYDYKLDGKKDLLDYNMEQQASIVQDNFILKNAPDMMFWSRCENTGCTEKELNDLFDKTLAKFTADQSYAKRSHFPLAASKKKDGPKKP